MNPNYFAHSFGVRGEIGMAQKTPDEKSRVAVIKIEQRASAEPR